MRVRRRGVCTQLARLLCGLLLIQLSSCGEEGDPCTVKPNLPGVCRLSSQCEPHVDKYIKRGILTGQEVPSCGFGTLEEIVCCPVAECCPGDTRPRQVTPTRVPTTRSTTRSITTTTTTTTTENPMLDKDSSFFDFQQLLNPVQPEPQQEQRFQPEFPVPMTNQNANVPVVTHEAMRAPLSRVEQVPPSRPRWINTGWTAEPVTTPLPAWPGQFQSMGPLGQAPATDREPRVINRPMSMRPQQRPDMATGPRPGRFPEPPQDPDDLVRLVNDRLRQQGMNIQPAREVNAIDPRPVPATRATTTRATTTTTTTMSPIDLDPWAPFRFRERPQDEIDGNELGNGSAEFGGDTTTSRTIQPTPTTRVNAGPDPNRAAARACRNYENGMREPSLTPHILKGVPVDDGVYPHMAAIAINSIGTIRFRCGGSLISSRHVLTAAHCVNDVNEPPVYVRLGTVNIEKLNDYYQDVNIRNISIHQDYSSISKYNDIAILELEREVQFNLYIYPACLELDTADPPLSAKLFVAGWGVIHQPTRATSKILLRAPLEIVPLQACNRSISEQPTSQKYLKEGVIDTLICAGDTLRQEADACQGDSGGPLVLETDIENNKFTILGIISTGFGCATKTPGLYTRVASYLDYIESIVWPNNVVPN